MDQCEDVSSGRQCSHLAVPGLNRCESHLRKNQRHSYNRYMYHLKQAQQEQFNRFLDDDESRSLRQEIALVRMMAQTIIDSISSDTEWIANTPTLSELSLKLERLLKTSHQIEKETGALLAKDVVVRVAQELMGIIAEEIQDVPDQENRLQRIAARTKILINNAQPVIEHDA